MPTPSTKPTSLQADLGAIPPKPRISLIVEDWITVISMGLLALITMTNVVVRYLTSSSIGWTEEISVFLLIVFTMSASSSAFVRHLHIRIELFADRGSTRRQRRFTLFSHAFCCFFFLGLTVLLANMVADEFMWGDTSPAIGIPTYLYSMWLPVLSLLIALRLLGMFKRSWKSLT